MIQIIIMFAVMQLGFNLLFKPKYSQMSCGLFGAAADDVSKININKLKILGIFNDTRGGHSCGISIDGDIMIGTYKNKLFKDFISEFDIATPDTLPVVLGHTRYATGGQHNEDNAHPFGFGTNGDFFDFIGTHNGSLHNEDELAENHGIETSIKTPSVHNAAYNTTRNKIDSEILLEIVYKKGFKVLEEYEGAAALALYNTKKPGTIYLYHGSSPKVVNSKVAVEERPLFYYQESENVVYYSSLKSSLEAINDTNGVIKEFDHNVVYEIKKGNVLSAKKHIIDRSNASQINSSCSYSKSAHKPTDYSNKKWDFKTRSWVEKDKNIKVWDTVDRCWKDDVETKVISLPAATKDILTFHQEEYEKLMTTYHKDRVYYENLRFHMNKVKLHGIYLLTKDSNVLKICQYPSLFDSAYKYSDYKKHDLYDNHIKLYFVDGMQLKSETDYNQLHDKHSKYTIEQLSHCSAYPIKDSSDKDSICYYNGSIATLTFSPLLGKDIIKITNGTCKEINRKPNNFSSVTYYLEIDIETTTKINNQNKKIIETFDNKNDDSVMIDLYKENILATVEYCIDDTDVSLSDNYVQNQIKTKFDKIKEFVTNILTI